MNEELLIELMQKINDEQIQHGTCEIKFTFHDGIIEFYELTTHKRTNVNLCFIPSEARVAKVNSHVLSN